MVRVKVVGLVVAPISKFSGLINAYTLTPDPALTLNSSVAYVFSLPETGLKFLITMFLASFGYWSSTVIFAPSTVHSKSLPS